ncbi:MAG: choice-of-anchor Q domain-containing protein [Gammaproteobacteria bacterium]
MAAGDVAVNDITQCSLIDAINAANASTAVNTTVGACTPVGSPNGGGSGYTSGNVIELAAGTYTLTGPYTPPNPYPGAILYSPGTSDGYWYGPDGLPPIATNIIILGNPSGSTITRTGATPFRFFYIGGSESLTGYNPPSGLTNLPGPGSLTLVNLTLSNGLAQGGNGGGMGGSGDSSGDGGGFLYPDGPWASGGGESFGNGGNQVNGTFGGGVGGGAGLGGAVFNEGGTVSALNSSFAGNTAAGGESGGAGANGGDGYGGAMFNLNGTVTVNFSTLAANAVAGGAANGGTAGTAAGDDVYNLYFATPHSPAADAGSSAQMTVQSSILGGPLSGPASVSDCENNAGTFTSGYDLVQKLGTTCSFSNNDQTGNPQLSALAANGGPTETLALAATSPALSHGNPVGAPTFDQRGYVRATPPDVGAFEYGASDTPSITGLGNLSMTEGASAPTLSFTLSDVSNQALTLSVSSSNAALLPTSGITTSAGCGSDSAHYSCTLTLTPVANTLGATAVLVTATNVYGNSGQQIFVFTVNAAPQPIAPPPSTSSGSSGGGGGGSLGLLSLAVLGLLGLTRKRHR